MSTRALVPALLLLGFLGSSRPAGAETVVSGTMKGVTTWSKAGSPYILHGDVIIPKGSTLNIGPGVTVKAKPNIADRQGTNAFDLEILIHGTLTVRGAPNDTVFFTSAATAPNWGDWQGIVVQGPEAKADLKAAVIQFANEGIRCHLGTVIADDVAVGSVTQHAFSFRGGKGELDEILVTDVGNSGGTGIGINLDQKSEVNIRNSVIVGTQNGIAYSRGSGGVLEGTVVSLSISRGIIIRNSNPTVRRCTISGNQVGMVVSAGAKPVIKENNFLENETADVEIGEYEAQNLKLDFSRNWWGETASGVIEERILDALDDPTKGAYAVVEPVLTEATPMPRSGAP